MFNLKINYKSHCSIAFCMFTRGYLYRATLVYLFTRSGINLHVTHWFHTSGSPQMWFLIWFHIVVLNISQYYGVVAQYGVDVLHFFLICFNQVLIWFNVVLIWL